MFEREIFCQYISNSLNPLSVRHILWFPCFNSCLFELIFITKKSLGVIKTKLKKHFNNHRFVPPSHFQVVENGTRS